MTYEASALWLRTLGTVVEGDAEAQIRQLRAAFEQFRRHVEPLASEIALSVPGYTDHSVAHCDALWDTAGLVIGPDFPLNPAEAFVLGGTFLIHDLAMGLSAYREGLRGILASEEWIDLLWAEHPDTAPQLQEIALRDVAADPTWNGLTSVAVKSSMTSFLREMHARQAEEILSTEWSLTNGEKFYLLPDTELRHWYGEVIGKIARSHWLNVSDLEDFLPGVLGTPSNFPLEWTVDPVKVACVLRLADASQIDARRAQPLHTPFRNPQNISHHHWAFQERMLHPRCDRGRLEFTSSRAFDAHEAEAWWLAFDTVSMIDSELLSVDSLCADLGRPRMAARGVAGAADPLRFSRYVPTRGWKPIDARPHIDNPLSVIEALGGEALYGENDEVPIRELLANAYDASRARQAAQPSRSTQAIQVNFARDEAGDYIEIRDYGVGMSAEGIAKYLCDFGSSGWRSSEFRNEYPGALSSGYSSTGQYGIGFFSVFMIADEVTVVSRPLHGSWSDTHILEFREGITHRPVLRQASSSERLNEPGTLVRLRPRFVMDEEFGLLFALRPLTREQQCRKIQKLALTCSYPIDVSPLGSDDYFSAVDGTPWQERNTGDLYNALHSNPWGIPEKILSAVGKEVFEHSLTELRAADGEVVGRLGFRRLSIEEAVNLCSCYCGGFQSAELTELFGIASGKPLRAGRDSVQIDVPLKSMQDWCESQWEVLLGDNSVTEQDLLEFQWFAIGFGVRNDRAPLCLHTDGFLTPPALVSILATLDSADLVEGNFRGAVTIADERWFAAGRANNLVRIPTSAFAVGWGRAPDDEYPSLPPSNLIDGGDTGSLSPRAMWWNQRIHDPESEFILCLAEAWECAVVDVLDASKTRAVTESRDERFSLRTIDGKQDRQVGASYERPYRLGRA